MEQIKVGDTLWRDDYGKWISYVIENETKQSWIINTYRYTKVNKKTLVRNMGKYTPEQMYAEQEKSEYTWVKENIRSITDSILKCSDIEKLKVIQEILVNQKEKK